MNEISSFGSYLNEILTLKGIDKKHFAVAININRSLLYRFLSGEQIPTKGQLNEISEKLNLRATQQKKLLESYESSLYGWEIVRGRKIITNMLNQLNKRIQMNGISYEYTLKKQMPFDKGICPIRNKTHVINTALALLDSIKENPDVASVKIILKPDMQNLINILTKILNEIKNNKTNIDIKHIIRFKDILLKKNKLHNLKILEAIFPLSVFKDIYDVYCLTENYTTEAYETFFPNFISIDNKTAFVFSEDYENGLLYNMQNKEIIEIMNEEFTKICDDCLPLFYNLGTYEKQAQYMFEYEHMVQANTALLHPENGFYTFPIDIIQKKEKEKFIRKEHAQILIRRIETFHQRVKKGKALEIISLAGLKNFAKTGQPQMYKSITFNKKERTEILKNLLKFVKENENYTLYIMKENNPFHDSDFAVYTIGSELLYIVPTYSDFTKLDNIIIRNRGIVESFTDFLHSSFTQHNSIIDRNEIANIISKVINDIRM